MKSIMSQWKEFNPESSRSMKEDFREFPSVNQGRILKYLNNGKNTLISTDSGYDVFTGERIVDSYCILTDGEYSWGNTLAYYVSHYNLKLPKEFENKILGGVRGEYDNYNYRSANEMTIAEQIESAKKALESVIRLSRNNPNNYWEKKKAEIQLRIKQLESLEE